MSIYSSFFSLASTTRQVRPRIKEEKTAGLTPFFGVPDSSKTCFEIKAYQSMFLFYVSCRQLTLPYKKIKIVDIFWANNRFTCRPLNGILEPDTNRLVSILAP